MCCGEGAENILLFHDGEALSVYQPFFQFFRRLGILFPIFDLRPSTFRRFRCFPQYADEETFTLDAMRIEMRVLLAQAPFRLRLARQHLRSQRLGYPSHILLILQWVVGTSAIHKEPSLLQRVPDVLHDVPLSSPASVHIRQAPFPDAVRVFSEHSFTRARSVADNQVERVAKCLKILHIVVCHDAVGIAPLDDVLCQNVRPLPHHLVGNEQGTLRQLRQRQRRFPSRSGTQVQRHHGLLHILPNHM